MLSYKAIEIFTNEEARWQGKPVGEAVVRYVAGLKIAARCIVTRGTDGCYESGEVATRRLEVLSYNMPIRIYILLPSAQYPQVIDEIAKMVTDGIVAVHPLEVVSHRARNRILPRHVRVRDAMTPDPVTVGPETRLDQVAELLLSGTFTGVPVVDGNRLPVGVISQGDLVYRAEMPVRIGILAVLDPEARSAVLERLSGRTARDVMTSPAVFIQEHRQLTEAVNLMLKKGWKRLPVVDESGCVSGILSRLDIFRAVMRESPDWRAFIGQEVVVENLRHVSDIMRRDTLTVLPETGLEEVLQVIGSNDLQRVAVVDGEGRFLGLISDADLLSTVLDQGAGAFAPILNLLPFIDRGRKGKRGRELDQTAADVMRTNVVTVQEEATIDEAVELMATRRLVRLPVVDREGRFKGLISRDSLLRTAFAGP